MFAIRSRERFQGSLNGIDSSAGPLPGLCCPRADSGRGLVSNSGVNVNMVAGVDWPGGDPYLQRQNEGSITPTTRNALHLFGGANDYRTVDLPGLPDGEETGDAWLGVFKSLDGGLTWRSTLIPGYPQDTSAEGLAAPIRQTVNGISFPAAADPMVRAGLNGMLYYSGLAITRTNPPVGAVFVARYNDLNNHEASDPMQYVGMSIVADGRPGSKFYDKPSLAADLPRPGASQCSVAGQFFLGGNVYVAYTDIQGSDANTVAKIWFSRSTNCGSTWSSPILVSGSNTINQGSVMAIDIRNGTLYVAWRRFAHGTETNAILIAKSIDGGKTFSTPVVIKSITPFEQGTTGASIRSTAYPTMVTDAGGRVYVAWSERTGPAGSVVGAEKPDGRIMLANSPDGAVWSAPVTVAPNASRGHQFMPAISCSRRASSCSFTTTCAKTRRSDGTSHSCSRRARTWRRASGSMGNLAFASGSRRTCSTTRSQTRR